MILIATAIQALDPNASVSVANEDINSIRWHDGNPNNLTKHQILAKRDELIIEYKTQDYARNRAPLYPAIGDQLDALYHAGVFPTDMAAKLKKVKDDNPK